MSFVIDPPALFLSGLMIFSAGKRLEWDRHAKIAVGFMIISIFIVFSALLEADILRCVFPLFAGMNGSEFMLHTDYTGISKEDVPPIAIVFLFILYSFWTFSGYATALPLSKRKRISTKTYSYYDVRSQNKVKKSVYGAARGPMRRNALDLP